MSQPRDEGFQQNFCASCGAKIRSSTSFCISCGARLAPNSETPASTQDAVALDNGSEPEGGAEGTRAAQGEPQAARPMGSSADNQYGAGENVTSKLLNRSINWFRNLSSLPKLILVGLLLLLLLTVLSPIARVVAIIVFVVSTIVLVVRAIQRGPIKGWGIAVVSSLVLIFVFGSISGVIYGSGFTSFVGAEDESSYSSEIGTAEEEYISGTDAIFDETVNRVNEQIDTYNSCDSYCSQSDRTLLNQNAQSIDDLLARTHTFEPPEGYEESHDAFVSGMGVATSVTSSIAEGTTNVPEIDRMIEKEDNFFRQSVDLMPPSGRSYHDLHLKYQ